MPVCPTCDNRPFATKEALLQHVRTSSNAHPFCLACDRRFASELAYNAHMAAKHPPTFDCLRCGKQYASQFALEGHYRGHTDHPNCPVCGKGFYDVPQLSAHVHEMHNNLWCSTCNLRFESTIVAEEHYRMSPAHPKCRTCGIGCRDEGILQKHMLSHDSTGFIQPALSPATNGSANGSGGPETPTLRSPARASVTQSYQRSPPASLPTPFLPLASTSSQPKESFTNQHTHGPISPPHSAFIGLSPPPTHTGSTTSFGGTGFSPLSPKPNIFNKELRRVTSIDTTPRVGSPDISQMMNLQASPLLNVEAPVFSPIALPKPGRQVDEIWSSRENVQVTRNAQPSSSVPIPAAPPTWNGASKVASNGTSISKPTPTQQVIPFAHPYRYQALPPRHRASTDLVDGNVNPSTLDGSKYSSPTISEPTRLNSVTRTEYHFNPRLYPGSARHTATQVASNYQATARVPGSSISSLSTSMALVASPSQVQAPNNTRTSFDFNFRQPPPSLTSLPFPFSPPRRQTSAMQIMAPPLEDKHEEQSSESDDPFVSAVREEKHRKGAFEDSIAAVSPVTTPRLDTEVSLHDFGVKPEIGIHHNTQSSPSDFSTDFSTVSPASSSGVRESSPTPVSLRRRQPNRSRSRASPARSDISLLNIPTYQVVGSSPQASPFSPEVTSPVGLAPLPAISPLGPSPIDLDTSFDIPEARHPLPDSTPGSPFTIAESLGYQSPHAFRPRSVERPKSRISDDLGLYRDNEDKGILFSPVNGTATNRFSQSLRPSSSPSSPQSFVTSHQELEEDERQENLARFGHSRSSSRAPGSPRVAITDVFHEAEANVTPKSPSPTPSPTPVTPKAEEDIVPLPPRETVTSDNLDINFNKQRTIVAPSLGVTPNFSITSTTTSEVIGSAGSSSSLPSLQCRACRRETPDDITATMCGHVFCNRCIVDAVIKTSRCPFCSTPTLLYCLFRLDLNT